MTSPLLLQTDNSNLITLRGVLFRCTIRGGHATLAIIPSSNDNVVDNEEENSIVMIIVRMGGAQWNLKQKDDHNAASGETTSSSSSSSSSSDQFTRNIAEMRSNMRRMCKLGNEMEFIGSFVNESNNNVAASTNNNENTNTNNTKDWNTWRKFNVDYDLQSSQSNISVSQVGKWYATRCQKVRSKFFDTAHSTRQKRPPPNKKKKRRDDSISRNEDKQQHTSARGKQKRIQGEVLADFLLWVLSTIYNDDNDNAEQSAETMNNKEWFREEIGLKRLPTDQNYLFIDRWTALHPSLASMDDSSAVHARNEMVADIIRNVSTQGNNSDDNQHETNCPSFSLGGILDAAGGAGHVSLALSLRGIPSTVVDPRPNIGKLPGRDRKVLKKSKSKVQFSTYRAWFGSKPKGVDTVYREGRTLEIFLPESERSEHNPLVVDDDQLPICSMHSDDKLLPNCAAIAALHPDEATGIVVQTAVKNKIPFVVVPCCVFSRLFPERTNPGERGGVVSTYYELIDWLVDLHPAIRVTTLPFEGANIAVWATFQ